WQDVRNGNSDIYAQRYTACGTPLDSNYLVTDLPYANYEQGDPAVSANSSTIYYTWIDDRRVQGWDIYAKIVEVTSGMCGDVNSDGKVDVADINYLINYLMKGGPPPNSFEACDVNCDGKVSLSDVVYLINYLFKGGKPPCQPN
ncbi:MAG TPA: dockerin type I repeat-containing protein, partial [candidate division Zixibacteria bacterium]